MLPIDKLQGLYEVGQELLALQKSMESPDILMARDLLKIFASGVALVNTFEEAGDDTTELRKSANDLLKGFDTILLQMCVSNGQGDKTDKLQEVRKGIARQIALNQPCPVERSEIKQLERGVRYHENVVKAFAMMVANKSVKSQDLGGVRSALRENLTGFRKRLNQLVHGPVAIRSTADSLSERCSTLLLSEIVSAR